MTEIVTALPPAKVVEKVRWTEAQVTVLKQEVAKAEKLQDAFKIVGALLNKSESTVAGKWYSLKQPKKASRVRKPVQQPAINNLPTSTNLSTGQKLIASLLEQNIVIREVTINDQGMHLKF